LKARFLPLVVLAALAFLSPPAHAQQPCTWGTPTFSHGGEGTPVLWTRVKITCNGGISQCHGRVILRQWLWDPLAQYWVERPGTSQTQEFWALCGETITRGFTGPPSDWPPDTICCITTEFQTPTITGGWRRGPVDNFYFNNW
jgi:hypothetical protein